MELLGVNIFFRLNGNGMCACLCVSPLDPIVCVSNNVACQTDVIMSIRD